MNVINAEKKHIIFGYGYLKENTTFIWGLLGRGNPHSGYLWYLFECGIVGTVIFVLFILSPFYFCKKISNKKLVHVFIAASFAYCIGMISDDYLMRVPIALMVFMIPAYFMNENS
jgi:O-antigen ligase